MVSEKSSIGEISSKISWRPDLLDTSSPSPRRRSTAASQASLPISQSKLSVCSERSLGTSRGSWIFAKEMRREVSADVRVEERAAKRFPHASSQVRGAGPPQQRPSGQGEEHMRAGAKSHDTPTRGAPQERTRTTP